MPDDLHAGDEDGEEVEAGEERALEGRREGRSVTVSALISKQSQEETRPLADELEKSTAALRRIEERLAQMEGESLRD